MNCIVVDDNELSRVSIEDYVLDTPEIELAESFADPLKALHYVGGNKVDLIFLDVEMPKVTGIDFLKMIREGNHTNGDQPQVVLITSHEKYAVASYNFDVTDYLVKPVAYPRFHKAVTKALERQPKENGTKSDYRFFKARCEGNLEIIPMDDIVWLKSNGNYVIIQTYNGKYHPKMTMSEALNNDLPQDRFARAHKEYIVRLDQIKRVEANKFLIMKFEDKLIPIGEKYKKDIIGRLQQL